jgi:hypothetical protein
MPRKKINKIEAENLLWEYYQSELKHIRRSNWGGVYKDKHQVLINRVKHFAKELGIAKLQDNFNPLEREDS